MARSKKTDTNGANLGFEGQLWLTADKLRGNMEPPNLMDVQHRRIGLAQQKCCLLYVAAKTHKTAGS